MHRSGIVGSYSNSLSFFEEPPHCLDFPGTSVGKESTCNAGDPGSISGLERSAGEERLPTPVFLGFPGGLGGK